MSFPSLLRLARWAGVIVLALTLARWAGVIVLTLPAWQCSRTTPSPPGETALLPSAAEQQPPSVQPVAPTEGAGWAPRERIGWSAQEEEHIVARSVVPATTLLPMTAATIPTVAELSPGVFLDADTDSGGVPLTVEFTATVYNEVPGMHFDWNFGDGLQESGASVMTHTYTTVGEYTAEVVVRWPAGSDGDTLWEGGSDDDAVDIEANENAFDIDIDADDDSGPAPLRVELTATPDTDDDDTNLSDYRFEWQLGDGTRDFGPAVRTIYGRPGTYEVTVVATNQLGQQGGTSTEIEVNEPDID
jgi:PKD repeat protein